jgi:GrpB-like predicted nucleotidyltransferase (UPF0157 family)
VRADHEAHDADPDEDVWVSERPAHTRIAVVDPDLSWAAQFDQLADRIRLALGDRVLALEHIGSTSVPDLPAKPIIDIDLGATHARARAARTAPERRSLRELAVAPEVIQA